MLELNINTIGMGFIGKKDKNTPLAQKKFCHDTLKTKAFTEYFRQINKG
jgi:hypothetical protein